MLTIINQLSVKPAYLDQVEAGFLEHLDLLKSCEGFCGFRFLKPIDESSACIVEVSWRDEAAFEAWKQSEHFKLSHANLGQFREAFTGPPKFGRFSVSADIPLKN
ncbi:MAG: antibiotic biosynthesis monooxygenase [Candidatus Sericytochromatia bacterium]|nr:antibiotic biosynthesis monooxygenase [Candidatus Sericytochromatia bacterium]